MVYRSLESFVVNPVIIAFEPKRFGVHHHSGEVSLPDFPRQFFRRKICRVQGMPSASSIDDFK
jgi:hypothetical protein